MYKKLLLTGLLALSHTPLFASDISSVVIDGGQSNDDIKILRVGLRKDFQTPLYQNGIFDISGYHELSLNYWDGDHDDITGIAYSPVFTMNFHTDVAYKPYLEAGIGAALISDTMIDGRNMSSAFQFEDRFGIGVKRGDFDLHLRYMHYSNAGLKEPNDGIDIGMMGVSYSF